MVSKAGFSQDFSGLYGFLPLSGKQFRLNSVGGNAANYSTSRDWEFSVVTGLSSGNNTGSLYLISASKTFGKQYFYLRYTPGFRKDFLYSIGSVITQKDSSQITTDLNRSLSYRENFAIGYSFKVGNSFSVGMTVRNFSEKFQSDEIAPFFSDTLNYINILTTSANYNFWRGDFGFIYRFATNLLVSFNSENAIIIGSAKPREYEDILMNNESGFNIRADYSPFKSLTISAYADSKNNYQLGASLTSNLFDGKITASISAFSSLLKTDKFIGIIPTINYSSENWSITLSGLKKLKGSNSFSLNYFLDNGISNIVTNVYNSDRVTLSLNIALSFSKKPNAKFIGLKILNNIYPALSKLYLSQAIASARVVNTTGETISLKPAVKIADISDEKIFSPIVTIFAGDTATVFFYYSFDGSEKSFNKEIIATANFYLFTNTNQPDDQLKRPILIYSKNAWDGKVSDLKYYAIKDFDSMQRYAKQVINKFKNKFRFLPGAIYKFETTKILFNDFVKKMNYVADPRASVDRVQYPHETLKLKGGDCDDLSVAFSSVLESVGIQTAFVDYRNSDGVSHVNLLINTELKPSQSYLITRNPNKFIVRKDEKGNAQVWIPLEMTKLTNFDDSWSLAALKFQKEAINNLGLAKGKVKIVDNN